MSCGCLGVLYKPRYRRQVDAIYPRDPMDEKLIRAEMDKLTYYTLHHPEKLDRIGSYLESIMEDGLYKKQVIFELIKDWFSYFHFIFRMAGSKCRLMQLLSC